MHTYNVGVFKCKKNTNFSVNYFRINLKKKIKTICDKEGFRGGGGGGGEVHSKS